MFRRGGLKAKIESLKAKLGITRKRSKLTIADRGYKSKDKAERDLFSIPNLHDSLKGAVEFQEPCEAPTRNFQWATEMLQFPIQHF
jgi:hypothetical protein